MTTKNKSSENNFNAISHKTDVMRGYDYFESVVEELKMNGFNVIVIKGGYKPLLEYDTIAGYVHYELGKVAEVNDKVNGEDYVIRVLHLDNHRIDKVRIIKLVTEINEEDN